jgi:hypothetical protein
MTIRFQPLISCKVHDLQGRNSVRCVGMDEYVTDNSTRNRRVPIITDAQEPQHQILRHDNRCLDEKPLEATSVGEDAVFLGDVE